MQGLRTRVLHIAICPCGHPHKNYLVTCAHSIRRFLPLGASKTVRRVLSVYALLPKLSWTLDTCSSAPYRSADGYVGDVWVCWSAGRPPWTEAGTMVRLKFRPWSAARTKKTPCWRMCRHCYVCCRPLTGGSVSPDLALCESPMQFPPWGFDE